MASIFSSPWHPFCQLLPRGCSSLMSEVSTPGCSYPISQSCPCFFFLVPTQKKQFKPNYIWGKNSFPPQLFLLDLQLAYAWIKSTSFRCTASVVVFVKMSAGIIPVGTWWAPIRPLSVNSVQNHLRRCGCLVHAEYPFNLWKRRKVLQSSRFRCCFFRIHWTWAHVVGSWTWQTYFMQTV